ncbi:hypothetical protein ACE1SV_38210 [Streptomyces sp. E-15]
MFIVTTTDDLFPQVTALEDADPELVAIGERYWALAGFHADTGTPVWCERTADIETLGWGNRHYVLAAAATRAVLEGRNCPQCDGPLSLVSRTSLQQVCLNDDTVVCVECTPSLAELVRQLSDASRQKKRQAARAKARQQSALQEALTRWVRHCKEALEEKYPFRLAAEADIPARAGVRQMLATLALLRHAPSATPLTAVGTWTAPLHPDRPTASRLLNEALAAGLLRVHPSSPRTAFVWRPESFDIAVQEAEGDLDNLATPTLGDGYYPLNALFYAPYGTSMGTAAENLDAHLSAALDPAALTAARQADLLDAAIELIAEEALRYFTHRLDELYLPEIPENQYARLKEAAYRVAEVRPLGEIYNLVWWSTRAAAEGAQKHPRAPRTNMTTHALNQFESHAQHACEEPDWAIKPFSEITALGLAAMTRVLFYAVLDQPPFEASIPDIAAALPPALPGPPDPATARPGERPEALDDILAFLTGYPEAWQPERVRELLDELRERYADEPDWHVDSQVLARGAARLRRLHDRLVPTLGARQAALAVFAATPLLDRPVVTNGESMPCGSWIAAHLVEELLEPDFPEPAPAPDLGTGAEVP